MKEEAMTDEEESRAFTTTLRKSFRESIRKSMDEKKLRIEASIN
jgi:hypothetical protein